jgi:Beta-propeller repeat
MKPPFVLSISLSVLLTVAAQAQAQPPDSARIVEGYGKLPLAFEANQGQSDPKVKFLSRGAGYSLFLTSDAAVLTLQPPVPSPLGAGEARNRHPQSARAVLRMKLVNANPNTTVSGLDELPGKSNYFIGNDPKKWHANVQQFSRVHYENVYPGVDLLYYGHQRELEYDFVLQPGANPQAIRLGIEGVRKLRLVRGNLVLTSAVGDVHLRSPHIYQEANGMRQEVRGRYVITSKDEVGFEVAAYDHRRELVIDPVLAYATYLGGSGEDFGSGIAVDSVGHAYVTGTTESIDFPTANPHQPIYGGGCCDAFVTKFNADGSALVYSTYLGGRDFDSGRGIAVDSVGNAYVTGQTTSTDFPTANALQPTRNGGSDAFVAKINASGSALVYSTYLGGSDGEGGSGIAVDSAGHAYVTGDTLSSDFPTKNAIQPTYAGNQDVFVAKINAAGSALVFSTYLGGNSYEQGIGIAVDSADNTYLTGITESTDFPTANAIQPTYGGDFGDAFVTEINAAGSALVYSTYLGGNDDDAGVGVAVDSAGNTYVTGFTRSLDFPVVNAFQSEINGIQDACI